MKKIDLVIFLLAMSSCGMAMVSAILGRFFYFGIFLALGLGIGFFRQSKGMVIASAGLFLYTVMLLTFGSTIFWYMTIAVMVFSICFIYWEMRKMKEEIKQTLLDKGYAKSNEEIRISFVENPRYIPIAQKTFGTYFNPTKRAVKIAIGNKTKVYFYDIRKKELHEAKEN